MNSGYQHLCLWNYHVPWLGPRLCDLPTHTLALGQKTKTRLWICLHGCHKELDRNNSFFWTIRLYPKCLKPRFSRHHSQNTDNNPKAMGSPCTLRTSRNSFFRMQCLLCVCFGAWCWTPKSRAMGRKLCVRSFPANPQLRLSFPGALS